MAELETILSSIGLGHYYCIFVEAGFDTWDTVLGITEDDLASLAVQRGHRRRLQQEIAYSLNNYQSEALGRSPSNAEGSSGAQPGRKRQYTRHPKLDPNAPQRPLSAYVLFSNAMRDEMKDSSPSFAEKSKMVGDRWQSMPEAAKLGWRQKASGQWEKFKTEQAQYQKTDAHRGYQAYLAEFSAAKPSKKRKGPENEPSGQPDDAEPTATVKRSSSSGAQSSSTARPLAPAQGQTPTDPSAVSSPQSTESRKRRGSASNRRECSSATSSAHDKATQWYSHACESCKKKKVKCDGATPSCERCRKSHIECRYAGGVRDKEKRLVEDVMDKLTTWEDTIRRLKPQLDGEDQSKVNRLLMTSPRTTSRQGGKFSDHADHSSDSDGGESDVSNVGSMGSTDHYNEELFAAESGPDGRINAFLGRTATDNWVERLKDNLNISEKEEPTRDDRIPYIPPEKYSQDRIGKAPTASAGPNRTGTGKSMFAERFEPYELPLKASADSFVEAYFSTVHPSFPIISRTEFLRNYERFFAFPRPKQSSGSTFVPILHLILAVGAIHAYVTQAPWAEDERSRLLSFARAKVTVLDASIFQATAYEQVQICGLGGLYLLINYEVNKAWKVTGLGVRCAQALGLHLTNRTPNLTDSQRNLRLGIWFSMLSLERTIAVITGRPSMVQDLDCSMLLPDDGSVDPDKDLRSSTSSGMPDPWRPIKRTGSNHSFGQTWRHIPTITTTMDPTFFVQYAHLTSLAASVLTKLYSPQIRHVKWSELQSTILELDKQLSDWNDNLPASCRIDSARQGSERQADLIAIRMLFHSTRIIINRPCLCRLDRRIRSQSKDSNSININSASRCVASARCILALLPDQPDLSIIYQGSLWWMGFHHIKRAATVLILEITYLSEHTPAAGEDILVDAKKGINWLHAMGTSSSPAHSSWVTLSQLLLRAARKFGGDVSDAVIAEEEEPDGAFTDFAATQEAEDPQSFGSMFGMEGPNVQFEFEGDSGADNNMFGDLTFGAWDQFGFGPGSFFPAAGDLDETMEGGGGDGSSAA